MRVEDRGSNQARHSWSWRLRAAERIASHLDPHRFGVRAMYLIGSAKRGTAGPASDIDLVVLFEGSPRQREDLALWFEGWSLCLDEWNAERVGRRTGGLLDVHIVTDADIATKTSYATAITSRTDPARLLRLKDGRVKSVPGSPSPAPPDRSE